MTSLADRITGELIERAVAGDPSAVGDLTNFIFGTVDVVLGRSSGADDATQDVFEIVLKEVRSGSFDPSPNKRASAWVAKIAVNKARDYRRSDQRESQKRSSVEPEETEDESPVHPDRKLDYSRLQLALESLDEGEREVLLLYCIHEIPQAEVAETLGIATGTVKSRVSRGIKKDQEDPRGPTSTTVAACLQKREA